MFLCVIVCCSDSDCRVFKWHMYKFIKSEIINVNKVGRKYTNIRVEHLKINYSGGKAMTAMEKV